jgi:hypothetical protein
MSVIDNKLTAETLTASTTVLNNGGQVTGGRLAAFAPSGQLQEVHERWLTVGIQVAKITVGKTMRTARAAMREG